MKKMIKAVCIAVIIAVQTVFCITAHAADNADIIRELFALNMNERGVNDFYDGLQLGSADWYFSHEDLLPCPCICLLFLQVLVHFPMSVVKRPVFQSAFDGTTWFCLVLAV